MASSSSSNPSSTSSPSAARVLSDSERVRSRVPTRAAAPAVSAALGVGPGASASAPAVATSADTAPEPDASTSSAPGVTTMAILALEPDALTSASSSAPGVATIVDTALEPDASASTPSSALGVMTISDPSARTSAPGAVPTASATTSAPGAGPTASATTSAPDATEVATAPGVAPSAIASASAPNIAPDAIASASAPGVSRFIPPPSRRRRRDSALDSGAIPPPSKRRCRDVAPDSGGTTDWADLPVDILEMIFVKLTGPALPSAQVCYRWRISAMSFPRPVVLCPTRSGRMELLVPTSVRPRGANIAKSVAAEGCRSFSYITLSALSLGSHPALRLIGGSPSVPLFIDDCHRRLVARRFVGPPGGIPTALPETLMSIDLPQGVASDDIYCGIFAVGNRNTTFHMEEINKINGVFLATNSSIFGVLVKHSRATSPWSSVQIPLAARQKNRKFITATSVGDLTYFLDQTHKLLTCNMDLFGKIRSDELAANINELLNCNIRTLKTWIMHLSSGKAVNDSNLLCIRYEYNRPRCFRFAAYDLVVGEVSRWRVRRELTDFCIFIGWPPGAEAFVYWHPERIGLASGAIYDARQGMRSYFLGKAYRYNVMPSQESLMTCPFAIWIQQSFSIPYVSLPRHGIMAEALPPPAGDGADAVEKEMDN